MNFVDELWRKDGDVAAGQTSDVVEMVHGGFVSVGVSCSPGGTAIVEYSLNSKAQAPTWFQLGTVASGATGSFTRDHPTQAVRVRAAAASCSFTVLQGAN